MKLILLLGMIIACEHAEPNHEETKQIPPLYVMHCNKIGGGWDRCVNGEATCYRYRLWTENQHGLSCFPKGEDD